MPQIIIDNEKYEYELIESKRRKTLGINIDRIKGMTIRVPKGTKKEDVEKALMSKKKWIKRKIIEIGEIKLQDKPKEFVGGESFYFIGRNYKLKVIAEDCRDVEVILKDGEFKAYVPNIKKKNEYQKEIKSKLIDWYKKEAIAILRERVDIFTSKIGKGPKDVAIKNYKKKWGKTTKDGKIVFNWKLIMAPMSIIDYIVAHEMCHLVIFDHSKKFWSLVNTLILNVDEKSEWLRINGLLLNI